MDTDLELEETVNGEMAKYLSTLSVKDLKEIYCGVKDIKSIHSNLIKTCKQFVNNKNTVKRLFTFNKPKEYGRRYSVDGGLQGLPKIFRGALCKGITTDVDMVNAHPMILLYICNKKQINCPHLFQYCHQRDMILTRFLDTDGLTREEAKIAILTAINDTSKASSKNAPKRNTFYKNFVKEMKQIQEYVWNDPEFEDIKLDSNKEKGNPLGSMLNLLLCKEENNILELTINYLQDQEFEINTLCFDGMLIKGDYYNDTNLIEKLNILTNEYGIKWSYKPHDRSLTIPRDFIYSESPLEDLTEKEYADLFCNDYRNIFFRGDNHFYLVNEYGIYTLIKCGKEFIKSKLLTDYSHFKFLQKDKNINAVANIASILLYNPEIDCLMDKNKKLLPFKNGVFDLETREFRTARIDEYVSKTIHYDFEVCDFTDVENIVCECFEENVKQYALWKLGNILRGSDKTFTTMIGSGNNGKTKVVAQGIEDSLGGFYNSVDEKLITSDRNKVSSNDDKAKPALLQMKDSKINMVNELPKGVLVSSSKVKQYTGGNTLLARLNHSNEMIKFDVQGQLWIDTNTLGEFDEVDDAIIRRMDVLPFPYTFVKEAEYDPVKKPYHKLAVDDALIGINNYQLKFINMMLYYYYEPRPNTPQEIIDAKNDLVFDVDDVAKFIDTCKVGRDYKCSVSQMYDAYRESGGELKRKDFKIRMEHRGFIEQHIKQDNTTFRGFKGIDLFNSLDD